MQHSGCEGETTCLRAFSEDIAHVASCAVYASSANPGRVSSLAATCANVGHRVGTSRRPERIYVSAPYAVSTRQRLRIRIRIDVITRRISQSGLWDLANLPFSIILEWIRWKSGVRIAFSPLPASFTRFGKSAVFRKTKRWISARRAHGANVYEFVGDAT
jgi:hypothetical protein